jgi:hypothetical protein
MFPGTGWPGSTGSDFCASMILVEKPVPTFPHHAHIQLWKIISR